MLRLIVLELHVTFKMGHQHSLAVVNFVSTFPENIHFLSHRLASDCARKLWRELRELGLTKFAILYQQVRKSCGTRLDKWKAHALLGAESDVESER